MSNSAVFVGGAQKYFLPQGSDTLAMPIFMLHVQLN